MAFSASPSCTSGRGGVKMQLPLSSVAKHLGQVLLAAAGLALLLHLGHNWVYPGACAFNFASSWVGTWFGAPAVIAAVALLLYPRAPLNPQNSAADISAGSGAATTTPRPVCSFPVVDCLDSLAEACEHELEATTARSSLLKRFTRKLSSCKLFAVRFGKEGPNAKAPRVDIPFFRRKTTTLGTKSPRPSSENLRGGHWAQEHRSLSSRRQNQGLSRQDSGSVHESTTQDVASHAAMSSTAQSSTREWASTDAFAYTGHLAIDCLPYDTTEPMNDEVKEVVTELHLLQFGMMIGESSAELAIGMQGAAAPVGPSEDSLYGQVDCPEQFGRGWERIIEEHKEGLHYWVSRRHLRKGLFMYRSRTVYERATPNQMVCFTFADLDTRRSLWDDSATALEPIAPPAHQQAPVEAVRSAAHSQSSFMYARTRFPPPMSQREYVYARRVWYKSDDGGCYCINKAAHHPAPPEAGCRTARVQDFSSGFVIRAVPGIYSSDPAVEVSTVYFEDSRAHSGIINMGIRKAMWPMTQKSEKGLRKYIAARDELGMPFRRMPPFDLVPLAPAPRCSDAPAEALQQELLSISDLVALPTDVEAAGQPTPALPDSGPADAADDAGAEDMFAAGSGLRNAGMFSGYYPAITRRLHVTPILYAGYLGAWRCSAAASKLLVRGCMASWELLAKWHVRVLCAVCDWVRRCCARQLGKPGMLSAPGAGAEGLRSFPIQVGRCQAGEQAGGSRSAASRLLPSGLSARQRQGQGRRLSQLVNVAAKAVGLPLMHRLLSGRPGARGQELRFPPAKPELGQGLPASSAAAAGPGTAAVAPPAVTRRVRPVVVDGVVVGHCPPKQPRPQQPRHQARTLIQLMFGLHPSALDEAREPQAHVHHRPLSRRIM